MKKLWMRLGVSFEVSEDEEKAILGGDWQTSSRALEKIIKEGRFTPDGDSYIPEVTVEEFNEKHGTGYEVRDIDFDV